MNDPRLLESQSPARPPAPTTIWAETRTTFWLALPIIFGQILQNVLSVIDTLMVGRVSVEAVAAASLAGALFGVPLVFGFGVMGPFSVFVSGASARGDSQEIILYLRRGLEVALALGLGLALLITASSGCVVFLHQSPEVLAQARGFLLLLGWSIVPMYLFQILKQYCEALHEAWPPMVILVVGVFINIVLNWIFIFGHVGAPALGLVGAGWATLITRTITLIALTIFVLRAHFQAPALRDILFNGPFRWQGYKDLLGLGIPAGFQVLLEVGAFTFAAIMMGWISEAALAAHQITLSTAGMTFMVPLGLSMAVAVRVGHATGVKDYPRARACARGSLLIAIGFMSLSAITLCTFPQNIAAWFISDPKVILLASQLLFIAGLFQIFDGIQAVSAGALRGLHDVKIPALLNICAYWLIALPLSYLLAFHYHMGAVGIWSGLLIGLGIIPGLLLLRLRHKFQDLGKFSED